MNRPPPQAYAGRQASPPRQPAPQTAPETLIAERLRLAQLKRDRKAARAKPRT